MSCVLGQGIQRFKYCVYNILFVAHKCLANDYEGALSVDDKCCAKNCLDLFCKHTYVKVVKDQSRIKKCKEAKEAKKFAKALIDSKLLINIIFDMKRKISLRATFLIDRDYMRYSPRGKCMSPDPAESKEPAEDLEGSGVVLEQTVTELTALYPFSLANEIAKTGKDLLVNQLTFEANKTIGITPFLLMMFPELKGLVHIRHPELML
ncbi:hypothetical protein EDC96DRAFT_547885 [Choanephora cucurbitarum]|nr:hypothetical protein EDC96DRAFT_547885 [Choanephora cucurbitarum]